MEYKAILKYINDNINKSVKFTSSDGSFIFEFPNGKFIYLPVQRYSVRGDKEKQGFTLTKRDLVVYFDKDFLKLKRIINSKKNQSNVLKCLFVKNKKEAKELYFQIHEFLLKDFLNQEFDLNLDPRQEYFIHGEDIVSRYFNSVKDIPKKGVDIQIWDKSNSSIIVEDRIILHTGYKNDKYIYLGHSAYRYQRCSKEDSDVYSILGDKKKYYKMVLKKGFKGVKLLYKKLHNKKFTLIRKKDGFLYLKDSKREYIVSHPDLLVYFL